MATNYYINFAGQTLGADVTGWSVFANSFATLKYFPTPSTNSLNGNEAWLQSNYTDVYVRMCGFSEDTSSADTSSADCDVLVSGRWPINLGPNNTGIFARGTVSSEGYAVFVYNNGGNVALRLGTVVGGNFYILQSATVNLTPTLAPNVHYKLRLRCNGTTISATFWPRNATEPSPQLSVTNSTFTAQGKIGIITEILGNTAGRCGMAIEAFAANVGGGVATFSDTLPTDMDVLRDIASKTMTVYNYPSLFMQNTFDATVIPIKRQQPDASRVFQLRTLTVGRGRISRRDQLAWTYTLDGHDFYILRLGDDKTLVLDLSTGEWSDWGETSVDINGNLDYDSRLRIATGLNWRGIGALADTLGSDVVTGDDTYGTLYALDPEYELDYQPSIDGGREFERRVQGLLTISGRDSVPIWGVQLTGSSGDQADGSLTTVELFSSDDYGHTYYSHGQQSFPQGNYQQRCDWNSLGSITNPGRIFKIVDRGALARIDALDTYDAKS